MYPYGPVSVSAFDRKVKFVESKYHPVPTFDFLVESKYLSVSIKSKVDTLVESKYHPLSKVSTLKIKKMKNFQKNKKIL